jgi:hypothetical protein
MGAAQDLDKPDLAAVTAGLWDNRSNYDASGNVYPSTGGSGTSGAVLKSDQWRISVAGTLGGTAVSVGDVLVALVDTPGSTSSNWMVLQGNVVAFTGDSGSGGLEGLVPAPAAGDSAAGKFLKANGQWVAVSTSNLGSANLTSTDDARTFTLKSGGTATQNLQFLNSGGGNLLQLKGNNSIDFGSNTSRITPIMYLDAVGGSAGSFILNGSNNVKSHEFTGLYGAFNSFYAQYYATGVESMRIGTTATSPFIYMNNPAGVNCVWIDIQSSNDGLIQVKKAGVIKSSIYAGYANYFIDSVAIGDTYTLTEKFRVKGSGSTSATTTALFQNSASVTALKVKDDGYCILRANNAAIASGDLANNEMSFYIDESGNTLTVKVKYSSGTVKTVSLALI